MKAEGFVRIGRNFSPLLLLQIFNYLAPLLVLPFLTRVLPKQEFGSVMAAISTIIFAYILTDFGSGLSATYRIANNRENRDFINGLIAKIFSVKIFLVVFASSIIVFIPEFLATYSDFSSVFYAVPFAVAAQAYQPIWFFQGLEKLYLYSIYMAMSKLIYVALVLSLVSQPGDGAFVIMLYGLASLSGTLIAIYFVRREGYKVSLCFEITGIIGEFRENIDFFMSRVAVGIYTSLSTLLVGVSDVHQAAYYSISEQGYKAGQSVTTALNQALYPYMSAEKDWNVFFRLLIIVSIGLAISGVIVAHYSDELIIFIFGNEVSGASRVLPIMMAVLVVNYLGTAFGYSAMAGLGKVSIANKSVFIGLFVFLCFIAFDLLTGAMDAVTMAYAVLSAELSVFIFRVSYFFYCFFIKDEERI